MPNYKKMYFALAAKAADAVELLVAAQQEGEQAFVKSEKMSIHLSGPPDTEDTSNNET